MTDNDSPTGFAALPLWRRLLAVVFIAAIAIGALVALTAFMG